MFKKLDLSTQSILLIDWVNSIDLASCALVDSIEDLKSGVIPLEILSYLLSSPIVIPAKAVKSRVHAISNWKQFLYELPQQFSISPQITAESIIDVLNI